ncbi:hypothetical protein E2C01_055676 [Portunus trituberculatus]|uniref:Uncharacterized protein n=1 Tax=Portunus trituberculatus TaxID=210409 RepID=A0A5B7GRW5_PORTR|nr:hypothetical protein [Portunus trituberculatus]
MPRSSSAVASIVAKCETNKNAAVHTSNAHQPNLAFLLQPPLRMVGTRLPTVEGKESDLDIFRCVIRETYKKMTQKYWSVASRKCREQKVKRETTESGVCKKLFVKWNEPYKVEVLSNDGGYVLKDPFTGKLLKRAAVKMKPFCGEEQYLLEPQDTVSYVHLKTEVLPPQGM